MQGYRQDLIHKREIIKNENLLWLEDSYQLDNQEEVLSLSCFQK